MKLYKNKYIPRILGLGEEFDDLPRVFTAVNMPSLNEREDTMIVVPGAEKLIFDGRPIVIDLFSGCGGFSCGFVEAGWRVVASVENDTMAHITYAHNIPTRQNAPVHCYNCDIRELHGEEILANLGLTMGEVDAIIGGPPCPSFSFAGKRRVGDPRDELIFHFRRLVMEIQPKTWIMENVPGLKSKRMPDGTLVLDRFMEGMNLMSKKEQVKINERNMEAVKLAEGVRNG